MKIPGRERRIWLAVALLVSGLALRPISAQLLGPEFQVNSYTTADQLRPAVAIDGAGNFVVVWADDGQEGLADYGIFGQGFDPTGGTLGVEFHVNSFTTGRQNYHSVAANGPNNFLVVWDSQGEDGAAGGIFGRRFTASGLPAGSAIMVNSYTTGDQSHPAVATDSNGFFVVVWSGAGLTDGSGVFGQRFNSAGSTVGGEFRVNSYTTGGQQEAAVAADGLGNFVVVWADGARDGSNSGVFGQRFDSVGTPFGGEFPVNSYTTNIQRQPAVAADGAGNFVVVWVSNLEDGSSYGVFGQRFAASGSPVGGEFQINSYTTSSQFLPAVAADASGNFVVAWQTYQDATLGSVFAKRFNAAGTAVGGEFQLNSYTTLAQRSPAVAVDAMGNFVVAWQSNGQDGSNFGVIGRRMITNLFQHGFEANPPFWSDTTATMCSGHCDAQSPTGCFCDAFCAASFDCCLDACTTCGYCGP